MKSPFQSDVLWTVLVFGIVALVVSARKVDDVMEDFSEIERIVGGVEAYPGQFPWAVALYYGTQFICAASILNNRTLLTAAHCLMIEGKYRPHDMFHGIANVNRKSPELRIDFKELVPHKGYVDGSAHDDIAILKTINPIDFNKTQLVAPVCIAGSDKPERDCFWKNATAMGWGDTVRDRNVEYYPETLHYTEVKIVENWECGLLNTGIDDNKICAKGCVVKLLPGICVGDSGGPLVRLSAEEVPVQTGVAAYINRKWGCGSLAAGVFTRVSSYYDFIKSNTEDRPLCVVNSCSRFPF